MAGRRSALQRALASLAAPRADPHRAETWGVGSRVSSTRRELALRGDAAALFRDFAGGLARRNDSEVVAAEASAVAAYHPIELPVISFASPRSLWHARAVLYRKGIALAGGPHQLLQLRAERRKNKGTGRWLPETSIYASRLGRTRRYRSVVSCWPGVGDTTCCSERLVSRW